MLGQKYCLVFKRVEHLGVFLMNESWHDLWDVWVGCVIAEHIKGQILTRTT
jgi:hypothetical protein